MGSIINKKLKYLLIGPLVSKDNHSIGGTTVSFQVLVDYFKSNAFVYKVIDTNIHSKNGKNIFKGVFVYLNCFLHIPFSDIIILNINAKGVIYLSPFIYFLTKVWNKKLVVRLFGGNLIEHYVDLSKVQKSILDITFFNADMILLQTKRLIQYFSFKSSNLYWYPTCRKALRMHHEDRTFKRRFVYIGQIKENKGIDEIVRLKNDLANDFILDIFGPILNDNYRFLECENYYKGVLKPKEVSMVLNNYDVLLLPTYHRGEGYPGVIIEANQLAIPVISTEWLGIPELVIHNQTGILVSPKSYLELHSAVVSMNNEIYSKLSKNALKWSLEFDSDRINAKLILEINSL